MNELVPENGFMRTSKSIGYCMSRWALVLALCSACSTSEEGNSGDLAAGSGTALGTTSSIPTSDVSPTTSKPSAPEGTNAGSAVTNGAETHGASTTGDGTTPGAPSADVTDDDTDQGAGGAESDSSVDGSSDDGRTPDTGLPDAGVEATPGDTAATTDTDAVTRTSSTFTFRHFPIEAGSNGVWSGAASAGLEATSTTFDTVILENAYLRVTLLPDYGGRVLSIVHKPTNRELLYQNPVGTPYLMYEDIFYYDYLVIMGGIFPSFPEPEHGRYWNQPYTFEVISESEEAITIRMSRHDDLDVPDGVPEVYVVGRTDVLVEVDVTLRAGSTRLELQTTLTNTRDSVVPEFEFWTVTTLAPGSTVGQTAIPLNTRIMTDMDSVRLLESSWSWFGDAEERVADDVFAWNNLAHFQNWVDQGTAFANPQYSANWSGLLNADNDTGILRVSPNAETPGLKLWTFGRESIDVDLNDSTQWLRPTIEMWHGVTPEFWQRTTMAPSEVRQWREAYFPTLGLEDITAASDHGAVYLSTFEAGAEVMLSAAASLTIPDQTVNVVLRLNGDVVLERQVVVSPTDATTVAASPANGAVTPGSVFEAEFWRGDVSLLSAALTIQ